MALTKADCLVWEALARSGAVTRGGSLLEIGQANWYGDVPAGWLTMKVRELAPELEPDLVAACEARDVYALAAVFYRCLLGVSRTVAIDLHAPEGSAALRLDLNEPIALGEKFSYIVNTGTLEHVFDQRRALETIHDHCVEGGLMFHAGPLAGWPDHGLFHAQPGLWLDLATANGYAVEALAYFDMKAGDVAMVDDLARFRRHVWAEGSMFYAVLRKTHEGAFRVPMQGVYGANPDAQALRDWRALR